MPLDEYQQATLQECMQREGCPLCRAVWNMDTARFAWYVNDGVLDEETRRNVVRTLGFCTPHALYLSILEGGYFLWSHLGSCIVYLDVIKQALLPTLEGMLTSPSQWFLHPFKRKVFSPLHHLFHHDLCLLCFDHRQHEATYRERFAEGFGTKERFRQAYLQGSSLCLPHFQQVRSSLTEQRWVRMLDVAEFHALKQFEQGTASPLQSQPKQYLGLLYGTETILWSDHTRRLALSTSDVGPTPCLACQRSRGETAQLSAPLLDYIEKVSAPADKREQTELALCSWHAWWLLQQSTVQPEISRLEPLLQRTWRAGLDHPENTGRERRRACHICEWIREQEDRHMERLQHALRDREQQVQLCLHHGRAALRQARDDASAQDVALALLRCVAPLSRRLEAYVHKCTERFQGQLQPDELVAWFDAIRWFGGSDSAQFLLVSSPPDIRE